MALTKEEEKALEKKISEYSSELYETYPIFFENMNFTILASTYICSVCQDFFKADEEFFYKDEIDILTVISYCEDIAGSLDIEYKNLFQKKISDGTINFDFSNKDDNSYTQPKEGYTNINIMRKYNIEDILVTIHEFFHDIHFSKFEKKLEDENCLFYSELIAVIGDLYGAFYLYKNGLFKEDVVTYIKKIFYNTYMIANSTLIGGVTLDIYDKMQSFDDDSITKYIELTNGSENYRTMPSVYECLGGHNYHNLSTYTFGFIFSFLISDSMIKDEYYINQFKRIMENIDNYDFKDILSAFGINGVLTNPDKLYSAVLYIYHMLEAMIKKNKINFNVPKGGLC